MPNFSTVNAGESDSSGQLVGSAPQLAGQVNRKGGADMSPAPLAWAAQPHGRLPKSQSARLGGGGSLSFFPDRGGQDSDGYSTASEFTSR